MRMIFYAFFLSCSIPVLAQQEAIDKLANVMTDSLAYLKLTDQQISDVRGLNKTAAAALPISNAG